MPSISRYIITFLCQAPMQDSQHEISSRRTNLTSTDITVGYGDNRVVRFCRIVQGNLSHRPADLAQKFDKRFEGLHELAVLPLTILWFQTVLSTVTTDTVIHAILPLSIAVYKGATGLIGRSPSTFPRNTRLFSKHNLQNRLVSSPHAGRAKFADPSDGFIYIWANHTIAGRNHGPLHGQIDTSVHGGHR